MLPLTRALREWERDRQAQEKIPSAQDRSLETGQGPTEHEMGKEVGNTFVSREGTLDRPHRPHASPQPCPRD